MTLSFALLAGLVLGSALAAVTCRNRVHAGLFLALSLVGIALVFLGLNAEFIGFVQILVYVGAVAVLIVFAILLTRKTETPQDPLSNSPNWGLVITAALLGLLAWAITSGFPGPSLPSPPSPPTLVVQNLGDRLLRDYVLPLEAMGLLLTAALIGAAVIALPPPTREKAQGSESRV